jgi:RHS repeat-associated protein
VEYGNGTRQVRAYDDARRLMSIDHQDPNGASTLKIEYDWTINNLVEKRTETVGSDIWEVDFAYDNRNRLTRETRTKTSAEPDVVEYDIAYEYDQLGNRTVRTDHVCGPAAASCARETFYHYDVDVDPNQLTYATHHNRLLSYEVYDTSDPNAAALLRTVRYTYYDTGQASNITVFDEQQEPDPNSHQWHHDVALHYYTHGPLKLAVWGRWQEDENGPIDATYQVIKAREFRYDSARGRYMSADIATPQNDSQYWTLDGDPAWTDYEGDTPYADSTMNATTYAATQVKRFFGLAGEQDTSSGDESYRQGDLIGSTMATTDDTGSIGVSPVSYTAFGELLDSNGVAGGAAPSGMPRYQYAGEWGYESGLLALSGADPDLPLITLQHLGARWYQPDIGRFVQRDPIGIVGALNVWRYGGAVATTVVDPDGTDYVVVTNGAWCHQYVCVENPESPSGWSEIHYFRHAGAGLWGKGIVTITPTDGPPDKGTRHGLSRQGDEEVLRKANELQMNPPSYNVLWMNCIVFNHIITPPASGPPLHNSPTGGTGGGHRAYE